MTTKRIALLSKARFKHMALFLSLFHTLFPMGSTATMEPQPESHTPVVLELFTSQGCSSCPAADALLKTLSADDSTLLPLSFHVHYWDYLGWKDVYSSPAYSERQRAYASVAGRGNVFTPELIVNGTASVVGSNAYSVQRAISKAKQSPAILEASLAPDPDSHHLLVSLKVKDHSLTPQIVDVWEVRFKRYANVHIGAGENSGSTLESINNVTHLTLLGTWQPQDGDKTFALEDTADDGTAILVQMQKQGTILTAASYLKQQ